MSIIINKDKRIKPPKFDLLSPVFIFPLSGIAFLLLGIEGLTFYALSLFGISLLSFMVSYRFSRPGGDERYPLIWKLGFPLFLAGAIAEFINLIYIGSIPLLVPSMRSKMIPALTYISFLIVPGSIIKISDSLLGKRNKESGFWLLAGLFLISLLGYRTEIFVLLLSAFFSAYYIKGGQLKSRKAVKYLSLFILVLIIANLAVVLFRDMPVTSSMDRFSYTTHVFSSMADSMGFSLFGLGQGIVHTSILSSLHIIPGPRIGPRTFISQLLGITGGSTTPTIIGVPFADYGILGVVLLGLILGLLFGSGYKTLLKGNVDILPMHALCMAFLLISIETGIADVIVLIYFIAYLIMII